MSRKSIKKKKKKSFDIVFLAENKICHLKGRDEVKLEDGEGIKTRPSKIKVMFFLY